MANPIVLEDPRHIEFVEWLVSDPRARGTQEALAERLGVSPRTLRDWKARPDVRKAWEQRAGEVGGDPERFQRVLDAMFEQATDSTSAKQVHAATAWAKMTGAIKPPEDKSKTGPTASDLLGLPREELEAMLADLLKQELAK
jgi:hypothetical protein